MCGKTKVLFNIFISVAITHRHNYKNAPSIRFQIYFKIRVGLYPILKVYVDFSQEELEEMLTYTNVPIYVRKLTGSEKCDDPDFPGSDINGRSTNMTPPTNGVEQSELEKPR